MLLLLLVFVLLPNLIAAADGSYIIVSVAFLWFCRCFFVICIFLVDFMFGLLSTLATCKYTHWWSGLLEPPPRGSIDPCNGCHWFQTNLRLRCSTQCHIHTASQKYSITCSNTSSNSVHVCVTVFYDYSTCSCVVSYPNIQQ